MDMDMDMDKDIMKMMIVEKSAKAEKRKAFTKISFH
jgi:hypothetical protein